MINLLGAWVDKTPAHQLYLQQQRKRNMSTERLELKTRALLERISSITTDSEDRDADRRVEITLLNAENQQLREEVNRLNVELEALRETDLKGEPSDGTP